MQDWIKDILRDPYTGEVLRYDNAGQRLSSSTNQFDVRDGIPTFILEKDDHEGFDYTKHYTSDAEEFDYFREKSDPLTVTHLNLLHKTVIRQVAKDCKMLLDVGCGSAFIAAHFCPKHIKVISLDIARENVRKALQKYNMDSHAALVADAYHLPFEDNSLDCIIASEIIEHTIDPSKFVQSLLSKVKKGGKLIISTPYKEKIAYSLCIHCNCKTPHNAHLHSFDKEKIRHIVEPLPGKITDIRIVGNKLLLHSRLSMLLSHFGFPFWSLVDRIANKVLDKAEHFVITIEKE